MPARSPFKRLITRRSDKVLTEKPGPRFLIGHQSYGTRAVEGAEAAVGRVVRACSFVTFAHPPDLCAGIEEDVVPAIDLADHREGAAPVDKLLDRGLTGRFGQQQLTQRP